MKRPTITIRIGAAHDKVTVDGKTFDRATMSVPEKNKLRRLLVAAIDKEDPKK